MQKIWVKKLFIYGIIVLLTSSGVVSAYYGNPSISSQSIDNDNWLYVGRNEPEDYNVIQSAIGAANPSISEKFIEKINLQKSEINHS